MKKLILAVLVILICATLVSCAPDPQWTASQYKAKVLSVYDQSFTDEEEGKYYHTQFLTIQFTEGPYTGQVFETDVFIDATNYTDIALYRQGRHDRGRSYRQRKTAALKTSASSRWYAYRM